MRTAVWAILGMLVATASAQDTWEARRERLGTPPDPYRILVDKVLMASNNWLMTPEHVAEIKAAGFNVVVPRLGADDNERVERVARMAADHGMFYMPWIRGTRVEKGDPSLRATDATGRYGELASPNADALWQYWTDRILFYAGLSRQVPAVMGVFLDFENYDTVKVGGGMCYTLSYDAPVLQRFAEAKGLQLPQPLPPDRAAWLEAQGQTQAFADFQVGQWRAQARALRQAVDALNPHFQFVVYPASQSLFIREAVWREWHTPAAPLIMAEVETYWRHEYDLGAALDRLRAVMVETRANLAKVDPAIRYMAGLDPVVRGANPEFEGKSAVLGAEFGNGYWVFYEGPEYAGSHRDYFAWYKRANDAILRQDYALWRQPAETPNPLDEAIAREAREAAGAKLVPFSDAPLAPGELERAFTHRPRAAYQVLLRQGEHLQGELTALKHAHITNGSAAAVVTPGGKLLGTVHAEIGQPAVIDMVAPEDGVYGIAVNSGRGKGRLKLTNRYVCLAGPKVWLVGDQPPGFAVPRRGAAGIDLTVRTDAPGEHAQVAFSAPDGAAVFQGNTRESGTVRLHGDTQGVVAPWRLEVTKAVEDVYIDFGETSEPRLATHPGRLLVAP